MADPYFMYKLRNGLLGTPDSYGGLLDENAQKQAQNAGFMNFGASLLAAGGPSREPTSLGQALGNAMLRGQQGKFDNEKQQLNALLLKKQIEKAQQVQNRNHVIGNALVDDQGKIIYQGQALDNVYGRVNPGDFTPESLAKFEKSKNWADLVRIWAPPNPFVLERMGGKELVNPTRDGSAPTVRPLSTGDEERAAAAEKARLEAEGKAKGTGAGEVWAAIQKKGATSDTINKMLDLADPLIDVATGSSGGAVVDKVAGIFGGAPDGAKAIGSLKVLQAGLMLNQPRMEGPQSNADSILYKEAAASVGDPTVPRDIKKAAIKTIRDLQSKYKSAADADSAAAPAKKESASDHAKRLGL